MTGIRITQKQPGWLGGEARAIGADPADIEETLHQGLYLLGLLLELGRSSWILS